MHAAETISVLAPRVRLIELWQRIRHGLDFLAPLGDFALRCWVAKAFWDSGMAKFASWDTTVLLFTYEYQVPLLPPQIAAAMATAGELALPVLLVLGLAGRFAALGLFILNVVAVIAYPALMAEGIAMHIAWGVVLFALVLRGPGRLSFDHWIGRRLGLH
jgi:putative oxidoreductase